MLRKILSAAGFFFLYLIVILLATFYQKPIFLFLLMLLLLLPPASYLAARYAVLHLQPEITTSLLFGHSGDEITVSFVLKNPAYLPLPDCTFHYTVSSPFYPNEESYRSKLSGLCARQLCIFHTTDLSTGSLLSDPPYTDHGLGLSAFF